MSKAAFRPYWILLPTLVCVLGLSGPAHSQEEPQILVSFDEIGSMPCASGVAPGQVDIYVTAHEIQEIAGYELELVPTVLPSFFLGKVLYGPEPIELGVQYEVRVTTGTCVSDPTLMGPSPWSWTLVQFQLGYFTGVPEDTFFCVGPASSSGASMPQYTLCDPEGTQVGLYPLLWGDFSGYFPGGACAVAHPTPWNWTCPDVVDAEPGSWGTLKSQFGSASTH